MGMIVVVDFVNTISLLVCSLCSSLSLKTAIFGEMQCFLNVILLFCHYI